MPSSIESCKLCANYFAGACGGLSGLGAGLIVYVVNTDKHTLSYYLAFLAITMIAAGIVCCICVVLNCLATISRLDQENKKELEEIKLKQKELERFYNNIQNVVIDMGKTIIKNEVNYGNNLEDFSQKLKEFAGKHNEQLRPGAVFVLQNMLSTLDQLVKRNDDLVKDIYQLLNKVTLKSD